MKHAATQELYDYWASLCHGRSAPERNDIDPAAIRGILADTFMIDVDARRNGPIRISGTRMNALFCRELKGVSLLELWDSQDHAAIVALIGDVLDEARPIVAGAVGAPAGHAPLALEMVLLPLRHKGRTHARLLGCLSPRAIPSWLGLVPLGGLRLTAHRLVEPGPQTQPSESPSIALRERAARPVRRGHFTVYDGGRNDEGPRRDHVIAM